MARTCPLCWGAKSYQMHCDRERTYFRCQICNLIFVLPHQFLSLQAEKAEYDLHQNSPTDAGYRQFLGRLFLPLQARLLPASQGLDFGSGPGPTLSVMLSEAGHGVRLYDPFYANDDTALSEQYDFITATEVIEHLRQPRLDLDRLWQCLKPGGLMGLMTKLSRDDAAFPRWHYKADRCHICFFSVPTFTWLAAHWQAELTLIAPDVVLLHKPLAGSAEI